MESINFEDFKKVLLKVGTILDVSDHPNADKLYVIKVGIGNNETRTIVAGIKEYYKDKNSLIGKNVIVVSNLNYREIRGIKSEGMLLASSNNNELTLITTDRNIPAGSIVS